MWSYLLFPYYLQNQSFYNHVQSNVKFYNFSMYSCFPFNLKFWLIKEFQKKSVIEVTGIVFFFISFHFSEQLKSKPGPGTKPNLMRPLSQINVVLRDIVVPSKLMSKFLILAIRNTEQNKETCGILAGVLQKNQLYISHLLIPKQVGTSDSCSTENEEEIFAFQDEHNLITLGWIHVSHLSL